LPAVQAGVAEATFIPLPETDEGTVSDAAIDALSERLGGFDAVAIGPGLTQHPETAAFVRSLVRSCPVPTVIDADALNAFAGRAQELADRQAEAVLTPHAGEFARLAFMSGDAVGRDRVGHRRNLA